MIDLGVIDLTPRSEEALFKAYTGMRKLNPHVGRLWCKNCSELKKGEAPISEITQTTESSTHLPM